MPIYPVPILKGVPPEISQGFGGGSGKHKGVDIMYRREAAGEVQLPVFSKRFRMPGGVPALAFAAGKVVKSSMIGTGGRVEIDHGDGFSTKYYHLRSPKVRVGQTVTAGQPVGDIYHNESGFRLNHLHFEMLKNGSHINPEPLLANAQKIDAPTSFLLKVGVAVGVGLLLSKYVFK
jgi:murein DD-endopeptidase MepM/ murein hydrolase activator NlpD